MEIKSVADYVKMGKCTEHNLNCAEAMLYGANEAYKLGLDKSALTIAAGFGGGMAKEKTCGLITGAIMVLSIMNVEDVARNSDIKSITKNFLEEFSEKFGSVDCGILKNVYADNDGKCSSFIFQGAIFLDDFIKNIEE